MKLYLDNNVVSAIGKGDTPTETNALNRLLDAYEQHKVDLVTSDITLQEIKAYNGPKRPLLEETLRRLGNVPVVAKDKLLGIHVYSDQWTCINSPMIQNEPLYESLLRLNLDPDPIDAEHVFIAAKQGCAVFLTCDGGVLKRADDIRQLCGLTVQKPSDLVDSESFQPYLKTH